MIFTQGEKLRKKPVVALIQIAFEVITLKAQIIKKIFLKVLVNSIIKCHPKNKASLKSYKTSQIYHYKDHAVYTPFYQDIKPTRRTSKRTHLG